MFPPGEAKGMFELNQVCKRYGRTVALEPTSLSIAAEATTVFLGPSGSGKSTILRLLNGLIWPDAGSVRFEDQLLSPANMRALRRRMGYVIQHGGLFPHLTAADNVALLARYLGWKPSAIAQRLEELCELTRFPADGLNRWPAQLSGGQRQRVSLMRALMLDPPVLLLDEPLGALDPIIRSELQADLREIFQRLHKTVVLVTHDLAEAAYLGEQLVLLREGKIVQQGTLDDFIRRPNDPFVTRFVTAQRGLAGLTASDAEDRP